MALLASECRLQCCLEPVSDGSLEKKQNRFSSKLRAGRG